MAESSIPVDLFNPGQIFACLGFLEAADVLCGDAEGGFDWSDEAEVKFCLRSVGEENPFEVVLRFLAEAEIAIICPTGIECPWPDGTESNEEFPAPRTALMKSDGKSLTASSLPVRLQQGTNFVQISHWLKADRRETCKLFAGQQVGAKLTHNMLYGDPTPKKKASKGFKDIFQGFDERAFQNPFSEVCAVGGRFGFDARGGWDALRIGTSLDEQEILPKVAPHVELLAAIGLENARPTFFSTYEIRYAAWGDILPITLCRVALAASIPSTPHTPHIFLPKDQFRFFRAHLGNDKQYKKCFFAEPEE